MPPWRMGPTLRILTLLRLRILRSYVLAFRTFARAYRLITYPLLVSAMWSAAVALVGSLALVAGAPLPATGNSGTVSQPTQNEVWASSKRLRASPTLCPAPSPLTVACVMTSTRVGAAPSLQVVSLRVQQEQLTAVEDLAHDMWRVKYSNQTGVLSHRRDCHSVHPPSPFSRRVNSDREGVPAE